LLCQFSVKFNLEQSHGKIVTVYRSLIRSIYLYINLACLSVCFGVCLFVSNKRQNGWTDRVQIFCGTSRDHREGLWMIKISNICLHQNSIFIKFLKILKIHEIFCENSQIIFVLFYDVHKENMFTINLEDWREAPSKASIYKLCLSGCLSVCLSVCPFVSNKRQNGWTDLAQILCGTSHIPREGF